LQHEELQLRACPPGGALIGIAMTGSATVARADIKDYEFQLVDQAVSNGWNVRPLDVMEFN
jgi:hypothetical protein